MINKTQTLAITSFSLLLSGCAGDPVEIAKIMKDKKAYSNQYFSTKSIPEMVLNKIPLEENARVFSDTKMVFETKAIDGDKTTLQKTIISYSGQGNGLFQRDMEYISNDITSGHMFNISYKGLIDIKWTYASTSTAYSDTPYEMKEVKRWDKLGANVGDLSTVEYRWGPVLGIVNQADGQFKCTVTKVAEAKEIHPKLTGKARYMDCEKAKNGTVFSRSKNAYLVDLGFAIPVDATTANYKFEFKLVDIINP
jgi:hypothetical protein